MNKKSNQKQNNTLVTRDTNIGEVVFKYPQTEEVFLDYDLHCAGCIASGFDTVYMGAQVHGMTDEEIDELIDRLNEVIQHGE